MQTDTFQRLRALANGLRGRATDAAEVAVGENFDWRLAETLDLIDHGEPGVAFENLAQNVYEYDVVLSRDEYDAFDMAGRSLGLDPHAWAFLEGLVA